MFQYIHRTKNVVNLHIIRLLKSNVYIDYFHLNLSIAIVNI